MCLAFSVFRVSLHQNPPEVGIVIELKSHAVTLSIPLCLPLMLSYYLDLMQLTISVLSRFMKVQ